jgi:predicted DNA-binding transcriptional regulator AlpA
VRILARRSANHLVADQLAENDMEKHAMVDNRALNAADAADYLGVSPSTLAKWRISGGGPRYVKAGRRVTYRLQDLEEWQNACVRRSTSDVGPVR